MADQGAGQYTNVDPEIRRIVPVANGRVVVKVVYVVLESQYQSSMSAAVKAINENENSGVACECVGYLLEELRDEKNAAAFKKDVEEANVFIGSLIFVQELAEQVKELQKMCVPTFRALRLIPRRTPRLHHPPALQLPSTQVSK